MAEQDKDQKTEHPTSKRLGEARDRGQLAISREVVSWVTFAAILIVVGWMAPRMAENMVSDLRVFIEQPDAIILSNTGLQRVIFDLAIEIAKALGLILIVLSIAPIIGFMSQTGLFASSELIKPDIERLSPLNGFKRLFSMNTLVEFAKSMGKLVLLGTTAFLVLWPLVDKLPGSLGLSLMSSVAFLHHEAVHLIIMLMLVFTVIAVADYYYQNYEYIKNLKMTRAEVKDEHRQQEGDPMIKNRLRQIRLEKARKRMMAQVPKADVVITNPTHYAIALQYDNQRMTAPVVLAKGIDRVAERIRDVATEHNIPFVSNPPLARALYDTVEIDEEIPTQHYRAVAEIISYVYKLKKRKF